MEESPDMDALYNNTMSSYNRLMPTMQPILYVTNETELHGKRAKQAKESGWMVRVVSKQINGLPVIKHMMADAMEAVPSATYFGYVNPEMLFDEGLVFTLKEITKDISANDTLFAIGREIIANIHGVNELYAPSVLRRLAYDILINLSEDTKLDYFLVSRSFDWSPVPDLVALVPGAANWLIVWSIVNDYFVYDITNTALAVRQRDSIITDKQLERHTLARVHVGLNDVIAGHYAGYPNDLARADCAPLYTKFTNAIASQKYIAVDTRQVVGCDVTKLSVKPTDLITVGNNVVHV